MTGLSCGIPVNDCTSSEILDAVKVHNLAEIDQSRRDAVTLLYAMNLFSEGGNIADLTQHLFTRSESEKLRMDIERQKRAEEETESGIKLLNALRSHARTRGLTING